ncbi:mandelate racemase/muconate lactonizing enzyme family protein [Variovorax ureilyticus]|uniref:Mandelate racemase/muconate lactonizing enzyme family protein n=1 Tax=Variovorax ureilyticus TaxID=1836198 RepID=A0ABU8VNN5_9BURK
MKVTRILLAEVKVPLPQMLRLGAVEIKTRDFVAVRIETDAGFYGDSFGYPRGTPLLEALSRVASGLLGRDPLMRREPLHSFELANATSKPVYSRALSLLDVALWDICAKVAELPLYKMLGGLRAKAPVTAVAGYYMDTRSVQNIADEVSMRLDQGYARVKVMLKGDDPAFDLSYVEAVTRVASGRVAADAHWSWASLTEAMRFCKSIDGAGLAFLEDPFGPQDGDLTAALQERLRTPVAAGEDVIDLRSMRRLADSVSVLRVDATTCGGITGALSAVQLAALGGATVFPHVFAPLHIHLACALPQVEGVEYIPPESGADPIDAILKRPVAINDGWMHVDEEPGAGLSLDWKRVERLTSRATLIEAPAAKASI